MSARNFKSETVETLILSMGSISFHCVTTTNYICYEFELILCMENFIQKPQRLHLLQFIAF